MSLDKFIGKKKIKKKKKKSSFPIDKPALTEENQQLDIRKIQPYKEIKSEKLTKEISVDGSLLNPDNKNLRNKLSKGYEGKNNNELIEIMINIVKHSDSYSVKKNLIYQLLLDNPNISINEIAVLIEISYDEAFILVTEIRIDMNLGAD